MGFEIYKSGKSGFRVIDVKYKNGVPIKETVPKEAWPGLGFSKEMSLPEARARASAINSTNRLEKKKIVDISKRLQHQSLVRSAYLPSDQVKAFEQHLEKLGKNPKDKLKGKIFSRWKTVQKLAAHLAVHPEKFKKSIPLIYQWFVTNEYAPDTTKKLIHVLNLWGNFKCDFEDKIYQEVKQPKGQTKEEIRVAYMDSDDYQGESNPLTPQQLTQMQTHLSVPGNFEWLYLSIWFGLRPIEVDNLKDPIKTKVIQDENLGIDVLWVYQSKLKKVPREKRWKFIPVLFKEQEDGLEIIKSGIIKRPLLKTVAKYTTTRTTLYGGRKAFEDLMINQKGRTIYEVSSWLGHQSLDMTVQNYKNRLRVTVDKKAG